MTQEYTPTTDEVCECWTTRDDIGNPYETDTNVEERHHEESVKFDRWLAAHDAQIRAEEHVKALELSEEEMPQAYLGYWGTVDQSGYECIKNAFNTVAELRKKQQQ